MTPDLESVSCQELAKEAHLSESMSALYSGARLSTALAEGGHVVGINGYQRGGAFQFSQGSDSEERRQIVLQLRLTLSRTFAPRR